MDELKQRIQKFREERDWDQFHSPANLAKSICIEAAELLEHFQWSETGDDEEGILEELADVLIYCLQLAQVLDVDPVTIMNKKMDLNEAKYPVEKAKGISKKYTEL